MQADISRLRPRVVRPFQRMGLKGMQDFLQDGRWLAHKFGATSYGLVPSGQWYRPNMQLTYGDCDAD